MRIFLILLVVFFSQSSFAQKLLILGDSLSAAYGMQQHEGWPHLLQQQQNKWTLINASISGETTSGGLARLPALLTEHKPDAVLIELGGNDGLRGFAPMLIQKNLEKIITTVAQNNAMPILMQIHIPPNYGPRYTKQFSELYPNLAKKHNITLWPFFMEKIAAQPDLMMNDGIHPNKKAQSIIRDTVGALLHDLNVK